MTEPARLRLSNPDARRLFLHRHALCDSGPETPGKAGLMALIRRLGFVQVDSIATVERAHHMILSARRRSYRPAQLAPLLERDRALFEHWTHDASLIPSEFFPHWRPRFARDRERLAGAYPFLTLASEVTGGYYMAIGAVAAQRRLKNKEGDPGFADSKVALARYYADSVLPKAAGHAAEVMGAADAMLDFPDEYLA